MPSEEAQRSTADLIAELVEEAPKHSMCCIAVAFEDSSILIRPEDTDRHRLLNEAVKNGGIPVGLIVADLSGNQLSWRARIYPEYEQAIEQAQVYMKQLVASFEKQCREHSP